MDYKQRREAKTGPLKLNQTEAMMAFETSKGFVASKAGPNYPAPVVAIECMQQAATMSRKEALEVEAAGFSKVAATDVCLLYTSPSPRDLSTSRMPSSA